MKVRDPPADLAEGELFRDALDGEVRRRRRLRDGAAAQEVAHRGLLRQVDVVAPVVLVVIVLLLEVVQLPPGRRRRGERRGAVDGAVEILVGSGGVPPGQGGRDGGRLVLVV